MNKSQWKYLCKECFKKWFESLFWYEPTHLDSYDSYVIDCEDCWVKYYHSIFLSEHDTYVRKSKLPPWLSRSEELNLMYPDAKIWYKYPYGQSEYSKISDTEWECKDWRSKYLT